MTTIGTANTASEMVRSATSTALRVAFRELELYHTANAAEADEVFALNLIDHNATSCALSTARSPRSLTAKNCSS
jgi:hypothetical protein